MRNIFLFGFISISIYCPVLLWGYVRRADHTFCRNTAGQIVNPSVRKRTEIQKDFSLRNGAISIGSKIVKDATECYNLCCGRYDTDGCNLAQMHYRQVSGLDGEDSVQKSCYLYACGSPSKCLLESNEFTSRYHVILLKPEESDYTSIYGKYDEKPRKTTPPVPVTTEETTTRTIPTTTTTTAEATTFQAVKEGSCPPGVPVALCSDDPCKIHQCAGYPRATCRANYCGGCNAKFYTEKGEEADCSLPDVTGLLNNHNEESVTVSEGDYEETPSDELPPVETMSKEEKEKQDKEKDGNDYYQSEHRNWLDGYDENQGIIDNDTPKKPRTTEKGPPAVIVKPTSIVSVNSYFSIPLLVALLVCVALLLFILYRYRCSKRGKPKKFNVDDGDYLINGMYL